MKFTLTGVLALLCIAAQAQDPDLAPGKSIEQKGKTWHYGVKAALNFSGVKGNGMKTGMVGGAELGAFIDYDLSPHWAIQVESIVSQNTVKRGDDFLTYYNVDGYSQSGDKAKLTYLNIPVLARYRVSNEWSFVLGPQIGFLLNDNENYLNYNRRAFKTSEIAGVAGAEFNISSVALFARYQFGITNINDVDTRYEWRARHLQIGIAVRIK